MANLDQVIHSTVSVGTTSAVALAAESGRKYALFINDSDTIIYLAVGVDAVVNRGIRLNANGDSYAFVDGENLTAEVINAISSGSAKNLLVTEGRE